MALNDANALAMADPMFGFKQDPNSAHAFPGGFDPMQAAAMMMVMYCCVTFMSSFSERFLRIWSIDEDLV